MQEVARISTLQVDFLFKKNFKFLFIYFWLFWVFIAVCRLSLVAVNRGYSLIYQLLIEVASLFVEFGFSSSAAWV